MYSRISRMSPLIGGYASSNPDTPPSDSDSESELLAYEQYIKYSTPPSDDYESESEKNAILSALKQNGKYQYKFEQYPLSQLKSYKAYLIATGEWNVSAYEQYIKYSKPPVELELECGFSMIDLINEVDKLFNLELFPFPYDDIPNLNLLSKIILNISNIEYDPDESVNKYKISKLIYLLNYVNGNSLFKHIRLRELNIEFKTVDKYAPLAGITDTRLGSITDIKSSFMSQYPNLNIIASLYSRLGDISFCEYDQLMALIPKYSPNDDFMCIFDIIKYIQYIQFINMNCSKNIIYPNIQNSLLIDSKIFYLDLFKSDCDDSTIILSIYLPENEMKLKYKELLEDIEEKNIIYYLKTPFSGSYGCVTSIKKEDLIKYNTESLQKFINSISSFERKCIGNKLAIILQKKNYNFNIPYLALNATKAKKGPVLGSGEIRCICYKGKILFIVGDIFNYTNGGETLFETIAINKMILELLINKNKVISVEDKTKIKTQLGNFPELIPNNDTLIHTILEHSNIIELCQKIYDTMNVYSDLEYYRADLVLTRNQNGIYVVGTSIQLKFVLNEIETINFGEVCNNPIFNIERFIVTSTTYDDVFDTQLDSIGVIVGSLYLPKIVDELKNTVEDEIIKKVSSMYEINYNYLNIGQLKRFNKLCEIITEYFIKIYEFIKTRKKSDFFRKKIRFFYNKFKVIISEIKIIINKDYYNNPDNNNLVYNFCKHSDNMLSTQDDLINIRDILVYIHLLE